MKRGFIRIITTLTAIVLTAKAGRITYGDHIETWYNLDMSKVIERSDKMIGLSDLYWIRDDGVKMYGPWVIVAAHQSKTRYSRVQTSLGEGIILDTHTTSPDVYDIATTW